MSLGHCLAMWSPAGQVRRHPVTFMVVLLERPPHLDIWDPQWRPALQCHSSALGAKDDFLSLHDLSSRPGCCGRYLKHAGSLMCCCPCR